MNMQFIDINGNIIGYQWQTIIERRPSVYWIIIKNNKILCIRPVWNDSKYALPGWFIEIWENPIDCLKREFLEETWYKINIINQQPVYFKDSLFFSWYNNKYWHTLLFFYEVKLESETQENL